MAKVRMGFVGAGAIAEYAAQSLLKHEDAVLAAVAEPSEDRRDAFVEKLGVQRGYATAQELFADDGVDGVYIAVPNKFHAPLAIEALEAGKHVLLEKPMAMCWAEANDIVQAAEHTGKVFMVGMNQRFGEDAQKLRDLVQRNKLGEVYHAKAYWCRREGIPRLGTWFGHKAMSGGGALLDIGVHVLDLCLWAMGHPKPVAVSGAVYTKFGHRGLGEGGWGKSDRKGLEFDVDDLASALIKFENGATLQLDASWAAHMAKGNRMGVELFGTEAGASISPLMMFHQNPETEAYDVVEEVEAEEMFPHRDRMHHFVNVILERETLCVTPEQALMVQRIIDAIYDSAESGCEVRLD